MNDSQARAFISYSHVDSGNLDQLKLHLRPIERKYKFLIWDDKKLRAGDKWRSEIDRNLSLADVIVVLLSKEFLASEFIMDYEYPEALRHASDRGAKIVVLFVSPCLYEDFEISDFHFVNDPEETLQDLQELEPAKHERTLMRCAAIVRDYLKEAAAKRGSEALTPP